MVDKPPESNVHFEERRPSRRMPQVVKISQPTFIEKHRSLSEISVLGKLLTLALLGGCLARWLRERNGVVEKNASANDILGRCNGTFGKPELKRSQS